MIYRPIPTLSSDSIEPISTDVGGVPELVTQDVGYLVPPNDSRAISDRINELTRDSTLRSEMGRNGREKIVNEFSVGEYISLYDEFLQSAAKTGAD